MDLRSNDSYWLLKSGLIKNYPILDKNHKTQVIIMGAGISGALAAYHLCKKGFEVIMVDKRHVGMGSTAASTCLLQYEIDTPLTKLAKQVGEKKAVKSYKLCIDAIYDLERIVDKLDDQVGFDKRKSFQYASSQKDVKNLQLEFYLRKKHGINLEWLEKKDIEKKFGFSAPAGILSKDGAQVDAYRLTHALLSKACSWGLKVYDNTDVVRIHHQKNRVHLETASGVKISAHHLVIACGYESQNYIPKKVEKLNSTYAIASKPFPKEKLWYKNALIWETAVPYLYLRTTSDNRIIVGGKDDEFYNPEKRDAVIPKKTLLLEKSFAKLFPELAFKADYEWAGTFASTKDGLPYIGSMRQRPNTSFALGFGGNGITFSLLAAQMIRDSLLGKPSKNAPIFAFDR